MKKIERKELKEELLTAIKKVLQDNKAVLRNKTEKAIKKVLKQIAKKAEIKKKSVSPKNIKKSV